MSDGLPSWYDNWRLATPYDDFNDVLAEQWYEAYCEDFDEGDPEMLDYSDWCDQHYDDVMAAHKEDMKLARYGL